MNYKKTEDRRWLQCQPMELEEEEERCVRNKKNTDIGRQSQSVVLQEDMELGALAGRTTREEHTGRRYR
jgi:hypothetical protein